MHPFCSILVLTALALATPSLALAQTQGCFDNDSRMPDPRSTVEWGQNLKAADPAAMQQAAGTWYAEIPAPQVGMVNYQYQSYQANGLFQYQDRTCSSTGCSENYGHGQWTARPQGDGTIFVMIMFSDLNRTNQCTGFAAMFPDATTMVTAGGTKWRRVQ